MTDAPELVEVVSRRHEILSLLSRTPRERHELVDELEDAKSTAYKGVSQLLEAGLVERTDDGLRPTLLGSITLRRYESLAQMADVGPFVSGLPPGAIDPVVFDGAEFITSEAVSAGRHLEYAQHLLETADEVHGVVPAASAENIDAARDRVLDGELTAEFVLSDALADSLRRERATDVATAVDGGAVLWRTEMRIPFGIFVARGTNPDRMGIEFRDGALVTGLLLNDTAESIAWAEDRIDRYSADAERVTIGR